MLLQLLLALSGPAVHTYDNITPAPTSVEVGVGCYKHRAGKPVRHEFDADIPSEGYILDVTGKGITVTSSDEAGDFYGLVTLAQMAGCLFSEVEDNAWTIDCCRIEDSPRYAYRGLMVDVSRHMRSKEFLLKHIDAMAAVKLNRLHLHLTDAAGWRLEVDSYPELLEMAAWRDKAFYEDWWLLGDRKYSHRGDSLAYGGYYTKEDIREIVEYARRRHVTVVPEIEMPGHSEEVCAALPWLSCTGVPYTCPDLCPGKEATFTFLENVLSEVMELFPSEYIHIGGDEAPKKHWRSCPDCQKRMEEEGISDVEGLQSYLITRIEAFLESHGRHIIGWDEILEGGLAPNATVMSWRGVAGGKAAVEAGHAAIMTPGEWCYIDTHQDAPFKEPMAYGNYLPLAKVYSYNPSEGMPEKGNGRVMGVQANLWSEYVPTDSLAEYMYWPRGFALAEVGWSQPSRKDYSDFHRRALDLLDCWRGQGYNVFDLASEYGDRPESLAPMEHLAVGCDVTYNGDSHISSAYPAGGPGSLTDGLCGGWAYKDGRWPGFLTDLDVTIDLGSAKTVSSVGCAFQQAKIHGILYPSSVEVLVSLDGENFTLAGEEKYDGVPPVSGVTYASFGVENVGECRYIRYVAHNAGGFIFADEIIVR